MNTIRDIEPMTYTQADTFLGHRTERLLCRNTKVHRIDRESIGVRLHTTDIVTLHTDGRLVLDTGGWRTVTTKQRINALLPFGYTIWSTRGVWSVYRSGKRLGTYADGLTIDASGNATGYEPQAETDKATKLRKAIRTYAKGFVRTLIAGRIDQPTQDDCLYCSFRDVKTGIPWGETTANTDHLQSHVDESYYVPSLLVRVIKTGFVSIMAEQWAHQCMQSKPDAPDERTDYAGVGADQTRKAIVNYLDRHLLSVTLRTNALSAV